MSGTGSNPAWVDGYIPPASEWNAWFGFKLDAASPLMDFAPFVSLTGTDATGPITGVLTVNDDIKTTADLIVNGVIYINPTGLTQWTIGEQNTTGDHLQTHSTGHYEQWTVSGGIRNWFSNNAQVMQLDASGNLTVLHAITTPALNLSSTFSLYSLSAGDFIQHGAGNYDAYEADNGWRRWWQNSVNIMNLDSSGNLSVIASVTAKSLQIGSSTSWQFFQDDLINDIQNHATGDYDLYRRADRLRVWVSNNVNAMTLDVSGNLIAAGTVHGTNITTMTATIDELRALVQGLQTRLEALEAAPRASHT
jgi:hypothetical protein